MSKRTCKFSDCVKPVLARRMCRGHYMAWRRDNPDKIRPGRSEHRELVAATVLQCRQCGAGFVPVKSLGKLYCSDFCSRKWHRENNTKFCETDGCSRPLQARGMCGKHYKEWYVENNPGVDPNPKHEMQCAVCGKTVFKTKSGSRKPVCSYGCRYVLVWGQTKAEADAERVRRARSAHRQLVIRPSLRFRLVIKHPEDTYKSVRFTSVRCGPCGDYFVWDNRITTSFAKYCSDACRTSAYYARRARRDGIDYHGRSISSAVRREVYERDGWVCQLCFEPVVETEKFGRWSPTLDHIIPRSMQLVPDHSPSNLRLAHNYCNAIRGDGSGTNLPIGREALSA